jgi:predicted glycosyltransferase
MPGKVGQRLRGIVGRRPRLKLLEFIPETAPLINRADRVVAMGGYNTMCEVLSFEKHALIVPRVRPKPEQFIRAERMRDLGLIDLLHPDRLTSGALTEWLARDPGPPPSSRSRIDFGGLNRIPGLLAELMEDSAGPVPQAVAAAVY